MQYSGFASRDIFPNQEIKIILVFVAHLIPSIGDGTSWLFARDTDHLAMGVEERTGCEPNNNDGQVVLRRR
jgi:hypothetical protein